MKKTLLALTILAAFVLTGCGSESKTVNESKTPEAKPAIKVEEQQKQQTKSLETKSSDQKEYKMGNRSKFGDFIGKESSQPLHQFKTNNN